MSFVKVKSSYSLLASLLLANNAATTAQDQPRHRLRGNNLVASGLQQTDTPTGASQMATPVPSPRATTIFPTPHQLLIWSDDDYEYTDDDTHGYDLAAAADEPSQDGNCPVGQQRLDIDIRTDEASCETSWILQQSVDLGNGEERYVHVADYQGDYFDAADAASKTMCLGAGRYRFTIFDDHGDGIEKPGYYKMKLDGIVFAGSNDFGYEEETDFTIEGSTGSAAEENSSPEESSTATTVAEEPSEEEGPSFQISGSNTHSRYSNDDCTEGQMFELDVKTDYNICETSWVLERITIDEETNDERYVKVSGHINEYYDAPNAASQKSCLGEGRYRFTIFDAFGDGIAPPGYYMLALDGTVLAGSSNFGYEESTYFMVKNSVSAAASIEAFVEPSSIEEDIATTMEYISSEDMESSPETILVDGVAVSSEPTSKPTPSPTSKAPTAAPSASTSEPTSSTPTSAPQASMMTIEEEPLVQGDSHMQAAESILRDGPATISHPPTWTEIVTDDFEDGLGIFHASSSDSQHVTYYPYVKERRGVIRLQNENNGNEDHSSSSSIVTSDNIAIDDQIQLVFSYYANSMEVTDGFCIDYSIDDGSSWRTQKCWHAVDDFDNGMWYDDVSVSFNLKEDHASQYDMADGIRIRFRCKADSLNDDVLIDKVQLLGKASEVVLKDAMM